MLPGDVRAAAFRKRRAASLAIVLAAAALATCVGDVEPPPPPTIEQPPPPPPIEPWDNAYVNGTFPTPLPVADAQEILARSRLFLIPPPPDPDTGRNSFYFPPNIRAEDGIKAKRSAARKIQAFSALVDAPEAVARFESLSRTSEPAPLLYALCGLRLVDPVGYGRLASALAGSKVDATYLTEFGGCVVEHRTLGDMVADISRGEYCSRIRELRAAADDYLKSPQSVDSAASGQ